MKISEKNLNKKGFFFFYLTFCTILHSVLLPLNSDFQLPEFLKVVVLISDVFSFKLKCSCTTHHVMKTKQNKKQLFSGLMVSVSLHHLHMTSNINHFFFLFFHTHALLCDF